MICEACGISVRHLPTGHGTLVVDRWAATDGTVTWANGRATAHPDAAAARREAALPGVAADRFRPHQVTCPAQQRAAA